MTIKVGINGMGRIGRMIVRSIIESENKNLKIQHINNRSNSEATCTLIKYDSIHGKFNANLDFDENHLIINNKKITFSQESNIENIDWKKFDVDYVFECTGKFNSREKLLAHIQNGAKKVIVSAPCKNADKTIVFGVNEKDLSGKDQIISAASCTTNCLAPIVDVLNKNFKIEKGYMTTVHAFTSDQRLLDNSHKDPRRARAASQSIIPTSTGATKSIWEIIPELKGKLEGISLRVPTPNVSLVQFIFCTKININRDEINKAFELASKNQLKDIIEVTHEKLVSVDYNHHPASAIIDVNLTSVIGTKMGKVSAWYDNEWGFSNRMCDIAEFISQNS